MKRLVKSIIVLLAGLWASPVLAAEVDPARLAQDLETLRDENNLVGAGAAIWVDGEMRAIHVTGLRQIRTDNAVEIDDKWHLGSVGKSMTGVLLAKLAEDGILSFDTPLVEALPHLADRMDPGWHAVTLHDLMTHTAGAPANFGIGTLIKQPDTAEAARAARTEAIAKILAKAPRTAPGEAFRYSNVGITIAGHVAETALDQPFQTIMRERMFEPMGLTSAGFGPPPGDDQPWAHQSLFGWKRAQPPENDPDNTPIMTPAGRMHMNLSDFIAYGVDRLQGLRGEDGFIRAESYELLHTVRLDDYAYGISLFPDRAWAAGDVWWHNGSNTMNYALMVILPGLDAVMVFTANDPDRRKAEKAFFDLAIALGKDLQ